MTTTAQSASAERQLEGGYVSCDIEQLAAVWTAYRRGHLAYVDFRVFLALHEVRHRRLAALASRSRNGDGRTPPPVPAGVTIRELQRLVRCTRSVRVRASVSRLAELHLAASDAGDLRLPATGQTLPPELQHAAQEMARTLGRRGRVALPRRVLRYLAGGASAATAATMLAMVVRCLYWQRGGVFNAVGSCSTRLVADVFGVNLRTVKAARRRLVEIGWLVPRDADHWHVQRHGGRFAVNLAWGLPDPEGSPPPRRSDRGSAPPSKTGTSRRDRENQDPRRSRAAGACRRRAGKPALTHLVEQDLRDPERLKDVYRQALRRKLISRSEADRWRLFAAAQHALRVGTTNPCGLFVTTIRERRWRLLTQADEDRARLLLQPAGVPIGRDAQAGGGDQLTSRIAGLVWALSSSCSMPSRLVRAEYRTSDAKAKKNSAAARSPDARNSTATTSSDSSTKATFSASAVRYALDSVVCGNGASILPPCHIAGGNPSSRCGRPMVRDMQRANLLRGEAPA